MKFNQILLFATIVFGGGVRSEGRDFLEFVATGSFEKARVPVEADAFMLELELRFPWPDTFKAPISVAPNLYGVACLLRVRKGDMFLMCRVLREPKTQKLQAYIMVASPQKGFVTPMIGERIIYTQIPDGRVEAELLEGVDIRVADALFAAAEKHEWKPELLPSGEPIFVPWPLPK